MRPLLLALGLCLLLVRSAPGASLGIVLGEGTLGLMPTTKGVLFTWSGPESFRCLLTKSQFRTFQALMAQLRAESPTAPARRVGSAGSLTVYSQPGLGTRWAVLEFRTENGRRRLDMRGQTSALGDLALAGVLADMERPRPRKVKPPAKAAPGTPLAACSENLKRIAVAIEFYTCDSGGRAPASFAELAAHDLKAIPVCPVARRDTYTAGYRRWANDLCYEIQCTGGHHVAEGAPAGYPLYSWDIGVQIGPLSR